MKEGGDADVTDQWSAVLNLGASVMIPESMSPTSTSACRSTAAWRDRDPRRYRRFAAELIDRWARCRRGETPVRDVAIKQLAGGGGGEDRRRTEGGTVAFRGNSLRHRWR